MQQGCSSYTLPATCSSKKIVSYPNLLEWLLGTHGSGDELLPLQHVDVEDGVYGDEGATNDGSSSVSPRILTVL
jgi:hypothetical protein